MSSLVAVTLTTAVLVMSAGTPLAAQRGREGFRPAIPRAPTNRDARHPGPLFEEGRPQGGVPYVRDGRWFGHAAVDDPRFRLAQPFAFGRFPHVGPAHRFTAVRVDLGARRIWLPGGQFEVAAWDWPVTTPWCWTCDDLVVYLDPDHPGWYLLYDVRMGEYVHATFLGA